MSRVIVKLFLEFVLAKISFVLIHGTDSMHTPQITEAVFRSVDSKHMYIYVVTSCQLCVLLLQDRSRNAQQEFTAPAPAFRDYASPTMASYYRHASEQERAASAAVDTRAGGDVRRDSFGSKAAYQDRLHEQASLAAAQRRNCRYAMTSLRCTVTTFADLGSFSDLKFTEF